MSNSETIKYCIYEFSSNQNTRLGFPSADSVKYKNCDTPHLGNCKENESIQGLEECISIAYMLFLFLHAMAFKFKGCKQEVACHLIWDKFILLKQNFHCFWDTVSSHAFPSLRGIFAFARSQNRKTKNEETRPYTVYQKRLLAQHRSHQVKRLELSAPHHQKNLQQNGNW